MSAIEPARKDPEPELGPAMRAINPRWQRAVTALFLTNGNRTAALRMAGYKGKPDSMNVLASRIFADDRVRAAIREEAGKQIDIAEPELLGTTLAILRDTNKRDVDRLAAIRIIWDRANPVVSKTKLEITAHLTNDERDIQHYRALQKLGAPQEAFLSRFGFAGVARVQAMIALDEAKQKRIAAEAGIVDGEFEEVTIDE